MPGDRAKSALKKMAQVEAAWGQADRSWMKFKSCELCGQAVCINNYEDHRSRTPRLFSRVICPWCESRAGRRRMTEHILFKALSETSCLDSEYSILPNCKCLACRARRIKEKWDAEDSLSG